MHIDWWTLAFQTVNVLILVWLLARFFFRPVMAIVAKRQQEATRLIDDAAQARQAADRSTRGGGAGTRRRRRRARKADRASAAGGATRTREHAGAGRPADRQASRRGRLRRRPQTRPRQKPPSSIMPATLAVDMRGVSWTAFGSRICSRRSSMNAAATCVRLSKEVQRSLAAGATAEHPIDVISAIPLSDGEQQQIGATLTEIFGREVPVGVSQRSTTHQRPRAARPKYHHPQQLARRPRSHSQGDSQMGLNP